MKKDLFSTQASDYAKYRPHYPDALFTYLATLPKRREMVWDCGTGNGQAAVRLAESFAHVIATDPSEKQLAEAVPRANVTYLKGGAEDASVPEHSIDLVTVAQAFHWFNHEAFYAHVRHVCRREGAILAVWCYGVNEVTKEIDAFINPFYESLPWEPERRLIEEGYANVKFPFTPVTTPSFELRIDWTADHFLGYLASWSALQKAKKAQGRDPLDDIRDELKRLWGDHPRPVSWPLSLRAFRLT